MSRVEQAITRERPLGPGWTFSLALVAAVLVTASNQLWLLDAPAEGFAALTGILGYAVLAWAVILGVASTLAIVRRIRSRRRIAAVEPILIAAATVLVVIVMRSYPLWGTGSAVG